MATHSSSSPSTAVPSRSPSPHHGGDLEKSAMSGSDEKKQRRADGATVEEAEHVSSPNGHTQRNLKPRHLAMIALGGTIGTGLFVGSGANLAQGGPAGALLAYIIVGFMVYSMMLALGEMCTLFPDSGGFVGLASRFFDPALGFALGWNYWYCYGIVLSVELTAASIIINYWDTTTSPAAYITPLFAAIVISNFLGVRVYGEMEFWFSAIKISAIVGLIILGIIINTGGVGGGYTGFRYWRDPGAFKQFTAPDGTVVPGSWGRFVAFYAVLVQASFSFIGTEILGVTVGEAENPRVAFPRAVRRTFIRIVLFYVIAILMVGLLVPSDSPRLLNNSGDASASPFVLAILSVKIKALPSIVNAVLLIACWSAGNSEVFASSRTLYSLALDGKAPKFLRYCTKSGLPVWCIGATSLFGFISYAACGNPAVIFNVLYTLAALIGLITWLCILVAHLRMFYGMKRQGISRETLPFKSPFGLQPFSSWFGAAFISMIIIVNGFSLFIGDSFDGPTFVYKYIPIPIFGAFFLGWKLFGGVGERSGPYKIFRLTRMVRLDEIDFVSGQREIEEDMAREEVRHSGKRSWGGRVMDTIF